MTTTPAPSYNTHPLIGGALGPFPTGWKYADAAEVHAQLDILGHISSLGAADFSVTGADPLASGGTVTLSSALPPSGGWPEGSRLILRRRTPRRQGVALPDTEGHKPRITERALDHAMRIAQEDQDDLGRTVRTPVGETGLDLPPASRRGGRLLAFDDAGGLNLIDAVAVLSTVGVFADDGAWGDAPDPLTHDDGPFL